MDNIHKLDAQYHYLNITKCGIKFEWWDIPEERGDVTIWSADYPQKQKIAATRNKDSITCKECK
jgi:hypothetical protein